MTDLHSKSVHELRAIAQTFDIDEIFSKDADQLAQAIEIARNELIPKPKVEIPKPEYDARLMTKPPSKRSDQENVLKLLAGHIDLGLRIEFPDEESWSMYRGKKTACGSMRTSLRVLIACADKMMR